MMKSIRLLYIAVLGMIAGSAECTQHVGIPPAPQQQPPVVHPLLDLPIGLNGTPGLHMLAGVARPVLITKSVNNQNVSCLHVIVPGTEAAANGINAVNFSGNIYFPRNGVQPTTPEAVEYSCANIDNRPDSPITEWYMKMFGVMPFQNTGNPANDYIKAGWEEDNTAHILNEQRIISFDASVDGTMVDDPSIPRARISRRNLFEREFRKIASTSVGRVLLYRILIEVRRHRIGSNAGCTEDDRYLTDITISRRAVDRCRNVKIMYMPVFGFDDTNNAIFFYGNPNNIGGTTPLIFSVIGKTEYNYTHIVQSPTTLDVVLFHEMSHWFHHLRHPKRYYDEINGDNRKKFENCLSVNLYYWDDIDVRNMPQNYANIWYAGNLDGNLDFEEMRNMLGMPHDRQDILKGDDLCENLYRMNQGLPLRFGYSGVMFYEDKKVTDRVIDACITNNLAYVTAKNNVVNFQYNEGVNGAGASKIHH